MYRPGIWSRQQLSKVPEETFGFRITVAYNLLISEPACPEDLKVFERTTRAIKLSSGVYRTTYRSRFSDLDLVTRRIMRKVFAADQNIQVHDWAASTGVLSVEWAKQTLAHFPHAALTASDYFLFLIEAQNSAGETYILEPDGTAIQYIKPPFVVPLVGKERIIFVLNRLAMAWARRAVDELKRLAKQLQWNSIPDRQTYFLGKWGFRQINLIHPEAQRLAADNERFRVVQHDAFCKLAQPCQVLRVMNFYNPRIWGYQKTTSGIRAALESVADGGLLILGRTLENKQLRTNNVSIFQKTGTGVALLERLGAGFEMENEVLSFPAAR